jgi:YegS/Rv2252/BmrU family lipid kinase
MQDQALIIVNPKSGRGMTERKWASLATAIRTHLGPFQLEFTKAAQHAVEIAEREARNGRKLIIAMGGDGTVSEVANGILKAGTQTALGLLPGGTGGDFRRTLNIPQDIVKASQQIKNGQDRLMDAGELTYIDHHGVQQKRFFVNTASFGMSGAVAFRANRSTKRLGGTLTYATATLRTVFSFQTPEVILQFDDQEKKRMKIVIVCVANGPSFGGGMKIAPNAKLDDGVFDVVIAGDMQAAKLLLNSYKLYSGSHLSMDKMALIQARKIAAMPVRADEKILLEVDGETPGRLPATIEILDQVLRVRL